MAKQSTQAWLTSVATTVSIAVNGWVLTELIQLKTDVAVLKYQAFKVARHEDRRPPNLAGAGLPLERFLLPKGEDNGSKEAVAK